MDEIASIVPHNEFCQQQANYDAESWEEAFSKVQKFAELARNMQTSISPETVISGISRFLEKNRAQIDYSFRDEELLAELLPSVAISTKVLTDNSPASVDVERIEVILEANMDLLLKFNIEKYPELRPQYLSVLDYCYGYLSAGVSDKAFAVIDSFAHATPEALKDVVSYSPTYVLPILEGDRGIDEQGKMMLALRDLRNQRDLEGAHDTVRMYLETSTPLTQQELIRQVYVSSINIANLDTEALTKAWASGALGLVDSENTDPVQNLERNIATISELKKQYGEDAVAKLHTENGICHFGRYPEEAFKRILERDRNNPTVTVIYPYADHNAVFYQDAETFKGILGAQEKFNLNIIEAGNGTDAYIRMKQIMQKTHDESLDVLIVGGHGLPDSLAFGTADMGNESTITKELLSPAVLRLVNRLLDEHTTLIFCACNVGRDIDEGSLAKHVFEGTKVKKVIAATNPISGLRNFRVVQHRDETHSVEVDTDFARNQDLGAVRKQVFTR